MSENKFILALNCGSSSLKYQVYDVNKKTLLAKGNVERVGSEDSFVSYKHGDVKGKETVAMLDHASALRQVMDMLTRSGIGVIDDLNDVKAVGHRVVHGGDKFTSSVEITDEVIETIRDLSKLAPVHNPANLTGIMAAQEVLPNAKQVAIFDTAFHQTMPDYAFHYAVPGSWYRDLKVRRYGFHGSSHLYVSKRAADILGKDAKDVNLIVLHIGSGASACAIKNGVSVDTSTGMTPVEGLIMGTRPGDLDAGVPFYVKQRLNMTDAEIFDALNKKCGVLGITECFADRRDVEMNRDKQDCCRLAMEMEAYRIRKYIGSYYAALDCKLDAIVWTAGAGENGALIREMTMSGLEGMGVKIDKNKNLDACAFTGCGEQDISTEDSKIKVFMIPTNEEIVMIEDTLAILDGKYNKNHLLMNYSFNKSKSK